MGDGTQATQRPWAKGNKDAKYTLQDMIEMDEGYFMNESSQIEQKKSKHGCGTMGKKNTAVMDKSVPLEDIDTGKKSRQATKALDIHKS